MYTNPNRNSPNSSRGLWSLPTHPLSIATITKPHCGLSSKSTWIESSSVMELSRTLSRHQSNENHLYLTLPSHQHFQKQACVCLNIQKLVLRCEENCTTYHCGRKGSKDGGKEERAVGINWAKGLNFISPQRDNNLQWFQQRNVNVATRHVGMQYLKQIDKCDSNVMIWHGRDIVCSTFFDTLHVLLHCCHFFMKSRHETSVFIIGKLVNTY